MTERPKPKLEFQHSSESEHFLSQLRNTRQRTLNALKDLDEAAVDAVPPHGGSTIGAVLYHIACVEADWLFDEILGTIETDYPHDLLPVEMREDGTLLSPFTGETLSQHTERLDKIRTMLVDTIGRMTAEELHTLHEREQYDVTPAWTLHHLMQHEAEHRSQIGAIREAIS